MKFGIATFVTDEGIRPGPLAAAVEERGFDALVVTEHTHIPASRETPFPEGGELPRKYYRTLDPFVTLTAAAAATSRLLLGTGIALIPQRDVFHLAKEVASLDLLSGGRVLLGAGAGWNREEIRNHGTDPKTRGAVTNERLAAVKRLWTEEQAEFHGEYVDFDPVFSWPKPVQQPHPPIFVGGESRAALDRVAQYGDGWYPRGTLPPEEINRVRQSLADRGRPDLRIMVYAAPTDEKALNALAEIGVERANFLLRTAPEDESLRLLDEFAAIAERVGKA